MGSGLALKAGLHASQDPTTSHFKAFLEKSPLQNCSVGTDVNKGISGANLSTYRMLHHKRIKLYPVGPFFYSPATQHKQPYTTSGGY
ncbi:Protein SEED AND ROOT HAIR PROTECTIVE PROTEIN [Linum perenne]